MATYTDRRFPGTFLHKYVLGLRWVPVTDPNPELRHTRSRTKAYNARVPDGLLRVLIAREPFETFVDDWSEENLLWHLSISHAASVVYHDGTPSWDFLRCPSWDEMKHAKYSLVPPNVAMSLLFPSLGCRYVDDAPTCLHLWECRE